jgi:pimeloyl-ACP methyl ester carboxylesterase
MSEDPGVAAPPDGSTVHLRGAQGVNLVGDEVGPAGGRPVLLLHGGGQNRHAWKGTAVELAGHGYRVLSLDARGHGDSEWPEEPRYEMEDLADDLEAVLATLERPPAVVGASMGGMTSLVAQGRNTHQLFAALVLVDVTPSMEAEGVLRITGFMMANPEGFATLDDAADAIADYNPHRRRPASTDGLRRASCARPRMGAGTGSGTSAS